MPLKLPPGLSLSKIVVQLVKKGPKPRKAVVDLSYHCVPWGVGHLSAEGHVQGDKGGGYIHHRCNPVYENRKTS